jgi:hypothetical protein
MRPKRKTKMGWAPIISAMSALVVSIAALPSRMKGTTCPISESARRLSHSPGRRPGQTLPESALVSSIAAAATPTRASAKPRGSKARKAILMRRKDEPQRTDRKASPGYAAMKRSISEGVSYAVAPGPSMAAGTWLIAGHCGYMWLQCSHEDSDHP